MSMPTLARLPLAAAIVAAGVLGASISHAAPLISQTGNLLTNGNFESGSPITVNGVAPSALSGWNQTANTAPVSSTWASSPVVDGDHSALLSGNLNDGLWQYQNLAAGTYTLSGWVYVVSGSMHLGIAWNGGSSAAFGALQVATGAWEYVSFTQTITGSLGGALIYSGTGGHFYADGMWLNAGSRSTSAYDPSRGFNPNASAVPEPASLALVGLGLLGLARRRSARTP